MPDCANCGDRLPDDAVECPSCGTPVSGTTASFEPVGGAEAAEEQAEAIEGPVLVVRKGPQPGEQFFLDRATLTIGRDPECDIFLNDMTVSRAHATLTVSEGTVSVRDEGSLNGTYLNGVIVDCAQLADGDALQIGTFQMIFFGPAGDRR